MSDQTQEPVASTSTITTAEITASAAAKNTLSTETGSNRRSWKALRTGGSTANVQKSSKLSKSWEVRTSERKRQEGVKRIEKSA